MVLPTTINDPKTFNETIWSRMQRTSPKRHIVWKGLDVIITKGPHKERTGGIYSVHEIYPTVSAEVADLLNDATPLPPHESDRLRTKRVKREHDALVELLCFSDIHVGIKFYTGGEGNTSIANVRPTESVCLFIYCMIGCTQCLTVG